VLLDNCSYGSRQPDLFLTNLAGSETLRDVMGDNVRYTSLEVGDVSFKGLEFRGAPVIADRTVVPATASLFQGGTYPGTWKGKADHSSATHRF